MADFCAQCSVDLFGEDFGDLEGLTPPLYQLYNRFAVVICEGCGVIQVDTKGRCISRNCTERHGASR